MKLDDIKNKMFKRNPVAKNVGVNRAVTHKDKKKALGNPRKNQKHKKKFLEGIAPRINISSGLTSTVNPQQVVKFQKLRKTLFENKVWTKEEIRNNLQNDDRWLFRALFAIYKYQTEDEKSTGQTKYYNNVGFSGVDADFLTQAAIRYKRGFRFSEKYIAAIRKAMLKYSGQLAKIANGKI